MDDIDAAADNSATTGTSKKSKKEETIPKKKILLNVSDSSVSSTLGSSSSSSSSSSSGVPISISAMNEVAPITASSSFLNSESTESSIEDSNSQSSSDDKGTTNKDAEKEDQIFTLEYLHQSLHVLTLTFSTVRNNVIDLLECLFKHYLHEKLDGDRLSSHVWTLAYKSVLNGKRMRIASDSMMGNEIICDISQPRPLSQFPVKFSVGDTMFFEYDMGCTTEMEFKVVEVRDATSDDADPEKFPLFVDNGRKEKIGSDFLTPEEKAESLRARSLFETVSEVKYKYSLGQYKLVPPPPWSLAEEEALTFCYFAGLKFTKAWNDYLQYLLLSRSKGTSSGKWYQLKKLSDEVDCYHNTTHWLHDGNKYSKEQCLQRALGILRNHRANMINYSKQLDSDLNSEVIGNKRFIKGKPPFSFVEDYDSEEDY
jgi:hypothetical protein